MIQFTVNIAPTAQMRARSAVRKGQNFAITYKNPKQDRSESQLMPLLAEYCPETPLEQPLQINIRICLPIPKSKPAWWRECAVRGGMRPAKRPDIDNYVKHVLDCMQSVGFFRDDAQIVTLMVRKIYALKSQWDIEILELNEPKTKKEYETRRLSHEKDN